MTDAICAVKCDAGTAKLDKIFEQCVSERPIGDARHYEFSVGDVSLPVTISGSDRTMVVATAAISAEDPLSYNPINGHLQAKLHIRRRDRTKIPLVVVATETGIYRVSVFPCDMELLYSLGVTAAA